MFKCNTEEVAKSLAIEHKLMYGHSIFGGKWYVGSKEQLTSIGVVEPKGPSQ